MSTYQDPIYEFYGKKDRTLMWKGNDAFIGIEISYEDNEMVNFNVGVFTMGKSSEYPIERSNYNRFFSSQKMDSFSPYIWQLSPVLRVFRWMSADMYGSKLHKKLRPVEDEYVMDIRRCKLLGEPLFKH